MTRGTREFDIVLFGATGFVGRLTALHLVSEAPSGLRIALAGRSLTRLQDLVRDLGPAAADWPLVDVDAGDEDAVADLAARARVVVTTVGPYLKYGAPLAAACAVAGTPPPHSGCSATGSAWPGFLAPSTCRSWKGPSATT